LTPGDVVQRAAGEAPSFVIKPADGEPPSFSVVIPSWERPQQLERCLTALAGLDYPRERFEVIVVDDGSRSPIAERFRPCEFDLRLKWLRQDNAGPAAARNLGVQHASGDYLAFTDDDCTPEPQWLRQLAVTFAESPEALVGGRTINALGGNICAEASQLIIETAYCWLPWVGSELQFFASNNFALRADLFRAIGGFDASFRTSEDRDCCDRWMRAGRSLRYAPHAVVRHWHELTLVGYWRQHFGYGRGAWRFHRARERRGASRFRPELPFYREVFRVALETPAVGRRFTLAGLLVVWQLANAAGFFWQRGRDGAGRS
jgi:glycosyltransferase involved in cell wall biosynthesis